mmetsp:Transcript_6348/g.18107  ORF Transcript_6348/g.18107 Transcript_6348/m.18107 type:complete len:105 (-) Transcript_6348:721-1035(-)
MYGKPSSVNNVVVVVESGDDSKFEDPLEDPPGVVLVLVLALVLPRPLWLSERHDESNSIESSSLSEVILVVESLLLRGEIGISRRGDTEKSRRGETEKSRRGKI